LVDPVQVRLQGPGGNGDDSLGRIMSTSRQRDFPVRIEGVRGSDPLSSTFGDRGRRG
jgi:hypothetical protein